MLVVGTLTGLAEACAPPASLLEKKKEIPATGDRREPAAARGVDVAPRVRGRRQGRQGVLDGSAEERRAPRDLRREHGRRRVRGALRGAEAQAVNPPPPPSLVDAVVVVEAPELAAEALLVRTPDVRRRRDLGDLRRGPERLGPGPERVRRERVAPPGRLAAPRARPGRAALAALGRVPDARVRARRKKKGAARKKGDVAESSSPKSSLAALRLLRFQADVAVDEPLAEPMDDTDALSEYGVARDFSSVSRSLRRRSSFRSFSALRSFSRPAQRWRWIISPRRMSTSGRNGSTAGGPGFRAPRLKK